jgi:hypothetical protein
MSDIEVHSYCETYEVDCEVDCEVERDIEPKYEGQLKYYQVDKTDYYEVSMYTIMNDVEHDSEWFQYLTDIKPEVDCVEILLFIQQGDKYCEKTKYLEAKYFNRTKFLEDTKNNFQNNSSGMKTYYNISSFRIIKN